MPRKITELLLEVTIGERKKSEWDGERCERLSGLWGNPGLMMWSGRGWQLTYFMDIWVMDIGV